MIDDAPSPSAGPAVDARGLPAEDPTENVLALVNAAVKRLDDLFGAEKSHIREIMSLRQQFNSELRLAESARIDAIRAVDIAAVSRAAEVSAQQAATLAVQVQTSAETLRAQATAAATAASTSLTTALEPILKRLEELSKIQYEQSGQRAQQVESKGTNQYAVGLVISIAFLALAIMGFAISLAAR